MSKMKSKVYFMKEITSDNLVKIYHALNKELKEMKRVYSIEVLKHI